MDGTKVCTICKEEKPLTGFHVNGNGRHTQCAPCRIKYRKESRPGQARARDLRQKYGLTIIQFLTLARSQGEACAICRKPEPLYVDHDHKTGRVRGLCCVTCNLLVGPDRNHALLLRRAIAYVEAA